MNTFTLNKHKIFQLLSNSKYHLFYSFLIGALLTLGFAPFNQFWIGLLAPVLILFLIQNKTPAQSFKLGWFFGLGLFALSISWVFISIDRFGGQPFLISLLLTILLICVMSLFFALQFSLYKIISQNYDNFRSHILIFSPIWVLFEIIRTYALSGFPWDYLGYTQLNTFISNIAPVLSIYGVSFCSLIFSVFIFHIFKSLLKHYSNPKKLIQKISPKIIVLILISIVLILINPKDIQWTQIHYKKPQKIIAIQGDIAQSIKWQPHMLQKSISTYLNLSLPYLHQKNNIIIWPESAIPEFPNIIPHFFNVLDYSLESHHNALILGVPYQDQYSNKYYNAALSIGDGSRVYLKKHLVPFGEYVPFENILGNAFKWMHIPMSGFSEGPAIQLPLVTRNLNAGILICYEVAFPNLARINSLHSQYLVTLSDDAWFGDSLAPWQQAQMSQMRALETGRYIINDSNNGITNIVSPYGKILKQLPRAIKGELVSKIYPASGKTPWQEMGLLPIFITLICLIFIGYMVSLRKKKLKHFLG